MLSVLEKILRWLMWLGSPFALPIATALESVGLSLSKPVGGLLCLVLGLFMISVFLFGLWTLLL